jgi:hypothetical protein
MGRLRSSRQLANGIRLLVVIGFLCTTGVAGCAFDCVTSLCGDPVAIVNHTFFVGKEVGNVNANGVAVPEGPYKVILAVDLHARNITSISSDAFRCFNFSGETFYDGLAGVILDHNPLDVVPNGAPFVNVVIVSFINCSITTVPSAIVGTYRGVSYFDTGERFVTSRHVTLCSPGVSPVPPSRLRSMWP